MRRLRSLAVGLAVAALAGAGAVLAGCGDAPSAQQAVQAECAADKNACVEVGVGRPRRHPRGTIIEVQWQAADGSTWFPVMQADVTLSALGASWTHIEFNGTYLPPGGLPGRVADRIVLHRVAEHAVRLVLHKLADALSVVGGSAR